MAGKVHVCSEAISFPRRPPSLRVGVLSFTFGCYFFAERSKTCWSPTVNSDILRSSPVNGLSEHAERQRGVPSSSRTVRHRILDTIKAASEKTPDAIVPMRTPSPDIFFFPTKITKVEGVAPLPEPFLRFSVALLFSECVTP